VHKFAAALRLLLDALPTRGGEHVEYVMRRLTTGLANHKVYYNFTKQSLWHLLLLAKRNSRVRDWMVDPTNRAECWQWALDWTEEYQKYDSEVKQTVPTYRAPARSAIKMRSPTYRNSAYEWPLKGFLYKPGQKDLVAAGLYKTTPRVPAEIKFRLVDDVKYLFMRYNYMLDFPECEHVWGSEYDMSDDPQMLVGRALSVAFGKGRHGAKIVEVDIRHKEGVRFCVHHLDDLRRAAVDLRRAAQRGDDLRRAARGRCARARGNGAPSCALALQRPRVRSRSTNERGVDRHVGRCVDRASSPVLFSLRRNGSASCTTTGRISGRSSTSTTAKTGTSARHPQRGRARTS
jgi:hypothetical protein